jgi:predicted alpha-1,2-mannosidase
MNYINLILRKISQLLLVLVVVTLVSGCEKKVMTPADYVNPFIGTGGHGHTYPGATLPFGMVQLSPDTRKDSWDGCSGYHYSDDFILGFSHMHLSGTGVGDYGDVRFVPTVGELQITPGTKDDPDSGYGSQFSHRNESASAGYYSVYLKDYDIDVELTATQRAGFHKYNFPKTDEAHILIDLIESVVSEKILEAELQFISDHEVIGYRRTKAWAADQKVFFYASFSKPFVSHGIVVDGKYWQNKKTAESDSLIAVLNFDTGDGEPVYAKVGISAVNYDGAKANCETEIPDWNFNNTRINAFSTWNDKLSKIVVRGGDQDEKTIFYTALYHSLVAPNMYSDVDHRFRGHDGEIHKDNSFEMHTVFSLWDTFRTLHPLFTIIEQKKTNHLINSMLDMYKHDNLLPVWELAANETNCMIGYNSIPVITDAWVKGIRGFDVDLALKAMIQTANADQFGLKYYRSKGYIPADKEGESVSKTLEYAYDDWCISVIANGLGESESYKLFTQRAQYYKNIFDDQTGFFRGKSNGCFVTPFDPAQVNFMLTEANTWQYNFFVPQDINTHIELLGGDIGYEAKLDTLFNTTMELSGRHQSDITGLIGQYAHGNEPSHHMAYLYNYIGKPWKTQELIDRITTDLYSNAPDGLSGNEDCGQMSAWYVMSSMGFYPVTPGSDIYVIGAPLFDELQINLENGNKFTIKALRKSEDDKYIESLSYNGNVYKSSYITHDMIMSGGEMIFEMGNKPNKEFGEPVEDRPYQKITNHLITPVPYFIAPSKTFTDNMVISIADIMDKTDIYYSLGDNRDVKYDGIINITDTKIFTSYAKSGNGESFTEHAEFINIPAGQIITINTEYNPQYTAGGDVALINTIRGGDDFRTGNWQGYYGPDLDVVIDYGQLKTVSATGIGFLQDENSWIFMPEYVTFKGSVDGKKYFELGTVNNIISPKESGSVIKDFTIDNIKQPFRYLKITAKSPGMCPDWHKGAGNPCWIFTDEIWVK